MRRHYTASPPARFIFRLIIAAKPNLLSDAVDIFSDLIGGRGGMSPGRERLATGGAIAVVMVAYSSPNVSRPRYGRTRPPHRIAHCGAGIRRHGYFCSVPTHQARPPCRPPPPSAHHTLYLQAIRCYSWTTLRNAPL